MDQRKKRYGDFRAQLREMYLSVLSEPIPPNLIALVERLREIERQNTEEKGGDDDAS